MYRKEMGIDTVKLREEVAQYQKETNQLNAALAKANAKIEYLNGMNLFCKFKAYDFFLISCTR